MIRRTMFLAIVLATAGQATGQDAKSLRVYFVGNSVTDTINYGALAELAKSRGLSAGLGSPHDSRCSASVDLGTSERRISRNSPSAITRPPSPNTSGMFSASNHSTGIWRAKTVT